MRSDSNKKKGWREGEEGSGEEEGEEGRELSWQKQPQDTKLEGGRRRENVCALQELFLFFALISIKWASS